jgi:hypothetical protein
MATTSPEVLVERAAELAAANGDADTLLSLVGNDRPTLVAARDQVAARLHNQVDDFSATGALTLINRALAQLPPVEPFDWRVRWSRRRKP